MTTRPTRQRVALDPFDSYNAALQFYNQEFGALGERTNAFLIVQSIFVAAFGLLLASQQPPPIAFDVLTLGIIIAGISYCALHQQAGQSGSRGALLWREYMRHIESDQPDAPWKWFYSMYRQKSYPNYLLERPPLPSAWLASPAIFASVWFGALLYVVFNYILAQRVEELAQYHRVSCWLFAILTFVAVTFLVITIFLIVRGFVMWRRTPA